MYLLTRFHFETPILGALEDQVRPFGAIDGAVEGITRSTVHSEQFVLDIFGQFRNAGDNPLGDWLPSGARYDEGRFKQQWDAIAAAITKARTCGK